MIYIKFYTNQKLPKRKVSHFTTKKPRYKYDSLRGVVVRDGEDDIQELVQSASDSSLSSVLARFGFRSDDPYFNQNSSVIRDEDGEVIDKLNATQKAYQKADELRAKLGLPENMSISDVFNFCGEYAKKLATDIQSKQKKESETVEKDKTSQGVKESQEN